MTMVYGRDDFEEIEFETDPIPTSDIDIDDKLNDRLLKYCLPRLESDRSNRSTRIIRFAAIDKMKSTWQKLSPDDSIRAAREEATGMQQGIAGTLPIVDTHVEDTVAFFSEIYFPSTTIFYSNQGGPDKVDQITKLARVLEADTKVDGFYATGASAIRSLVKYNMGGFWLRWVDGGEEAIGEDRISGNRNTQIDVYNLMWDPAISDVNLIRKEGEWAAQVYHKNRLYILRGAESGRFSRVKELLDERDKQGTTASFESTFYKLPPSAVGLSYSGLDERSSQNGQQAVDWDSYGLGLRETAKTKINGFEIVRLFIWLSPDQLEISESEKLTLYEIVIADSCQVIECKEYKDAVELPCYISYFRMDEMGQAMRSFAESMQMFQRHVSFMANTAIATERGNSFGLRVYDPSAIEGDKLVSGQTSGWIATKTPGRDVRSIVANLNLEQDTNRHYAAIASLLALMKELFPSQGLPAQVAGIDRATNNQVAAVMIGAVRRLHTWVKSLDAVLFGPWRQGSYRNYVNFSPDSKDFQSLTEKDVASLLNSGLAQLNREVAAAAIERILFTLIQNPESAAQFDLVGLFKYWSMMLNNGIDLSQFVSAAGGAGQQGAQPIADPNAPPTPEVAPGGGAMA